MESMKTDNKPKAAPAKLHNELVADLATMTGIPVYELTFCVGMNNKPDLPLPDFGGGQGKLRARADREIAYLPKMLLYRVIYTPTDKSVKPTTFYIPREWATFQPLE